jgi:protein-tyrosine phosphatase
MAARNIVDLHSHILNGWRQTDESLHQALAMAEAAAHLGITAVVATLDVRTLEDACDRGMAIPMIVRWFQEELDSRDIPLTAFPGAGLEPGRYIPAALKRLAPVTLAASRRYVLLETNRSSFALLPWTIGQLNALGFHPVLANPERANVFQTNPAAVCEMVNSGALVQVAAASLAAPQNARVWLTVRKLLELKAVHFIATGSPPAETSYADMLQAVEAAADVIGEEEAWRLVTDNPDKVLRGDPFTSGEVEAAQATP